MTRLIITGACGRTGSAILRLAASDSHYRVVGILESQGHPLAGTKLTIPGLPDTGLVLGTDLSSVIEDGDVVVDFTEPASSFRHFRLPLNTARQLSWEHRFFAFGSFRAEGHGRGAGSYLTEYEHRRKCSV